MFIKKVIAALSFLTAAFVLSLGVNIGSSFINGVEAKDRGKPGRFTTISSNARLSLSLQYAQTNNATINIPGASRKTKKKNRGRCVQAEIKKVYAQGTPSETTWYELSHHHPRIRGKRHGDRHRSWRSGGCH